LLWAAPALNSQERSSAKQIYVALYERGPQLTSQKSVRELSNYDQHLAHIQAIEPRLVGAGPVDAALGQKTIGMMLFSAASDDDARKLAESDPFIAAHYTRVTTGGSMGSRPTEGMAVVEARSFRPSDASLDRVGRDDPTFTTGFQTRSTLTVGLVGASRANNTLSSDMGDAS